MWDLRGIPWASPWKSHMHCLTMGQQWAGPGGAYLSNELELSTVTQVGPTWDLNGLARFRRARYLGLDHDIEIL